MATPRPRSNTSLTIRNFHDAGSTTLMCNPLAILAALFDRLGRYEPAATIAGFALHPIAALAFPEITTAIARLRDVPGDPVYESLARAGEKMTTAAMAATTAGITVTTTVRWDRADRAAPVRRWVPAE